jgi:hypothetical protein
LEPAAALFAVFGKSKSRDFPDFNYPINADTSVAYVETID